MARVWIAEHDTGDVAVKVARSGPEFAEVLRRESALLATIRHPGVMRVLAQGVYEGRPWYAMPLLGEQQGHHAVSTFDLEEGALGRVTSGAPLDLRTLRLLCGTLAWLHAHGIVHRDMKPGNVLLHPDGTPVLGDFGIAVHLHDDERREAVPAGEGVQGTRGYASPEQRQGRPLDGRSDLYALGRMLLDLGDPRVEDLAAKLLSPKPEDRPPYAGMVGKVLEDLGGGPLPDGWPSESPRLFRAPLTGRHAVLDKATDFIHAIERGEGQSVLLTGPIGAGKTRLLREIIRRVRQGNSEVVTSDCGTQSGTALQGFIPLLLKLDDRCHDRGPLREVMGETLETLSPLVPSLRHRARHPRPPTREAVRDGVVRAVTAFAKERPCVLVIDDAHRADELTNLVLDVLLHNPVRGLGIILSARSEELTEDLQRWRGSVPTWEASLLQPADILAMATAMTAGSEIPADIAKSLVEKCAGSPLLATIFLDEAEAAGDVAWDGHTWVWDEGAALRDSVRGLAVLDRRIERLSFGGRTILDSAAVLGQKFSLFELTAITGENVAAGLLELCSRHIAEPLDDVSYAFTHDRILRAAYEGIDEAKRQSLHQRAASVLATTASAQVLGHHLLHGGRPLEAAPHLRTAAHEALRMGLFRLTEELVNTLETLDGGRWFPLQGTEEQAALLTLKARAVHAEGRSSDGLALANRALPLLGIHPPSSALGWGWVLVRELFRQARQRCFTAPAADHDSLAAFLIHLHWHHYLFNPMPVPFLATLFWAVNLAERCRDGAISGRVGGTLGLVYGLAGRESWSNAAFDRAEAWARADGSLEGEAASLAQRAFLRIYQGRWDDGRVYAERNMTVSLASKSDERMEYALFENYLLASNLGDMEESRRMVQALFDLRKRQQRRHLAAVQQICGAEQALRDGDLARADALVEEGHRDLEQADEQAQRANVWALEARLALLRGQWERALHACDQTAVLLGSSSGRNLATTLVQLHVPEVRVALLATDVAPRPQLLAAAQAAIAEAEIYCRSVAITKPALARARALLAVAEGGSNANSLLDRAIKTARDLSMPFELACSLAATAENREDSVLAEEARTLFHSLGAPWHAARVRPESTSDQAPR